MLRLIVGKGLLKQMGEVGRAYVIFYAGRGAAQQNTHHVATQSNEQSQ